MATRAYVLVADHVSTFGAKCRVIAKTLEKTVGDNHISAFKSTEHLAKKRAFSSLFATAGPYCTLVITAVVKQTAYA